MPDDWLASMYQTRADERAAFGLHWCGPTRFTRHGPLVVVALYAGHGDGQPVEVWCGAVPARFYEIRARPGANDTRALPAWTLSTGTMDAALAHQIALAISEGVLTLRPIDEGEADA